MSYDIFFFQVDYAWVILVLSGEVIRNCTCLLEIKTMHDVEKWGFKLTAASPEILHVDKESKNDKHKDIIRL